MFSLFFLKCGLITLLLYENTGFTAAESLNIPLCERKTTSKAYFNSSKFESLISILVLEFFRLCFLSLRYKQLWEKQPKATGFLISNLGCSHSADPRNFTLVPRPRSQRFQPTGSGAGEIFGSPELQPAMFMLTVQWCGRTDSPAPK